MRSPAAKVLVAVVAFALALGGGLLLMKHSSSSSSSSPSSSSGGKGDDGGGDAAVATSRVWEVGDTWTVKVRQDSGAVTPDGDRSVAAIPFRFEVVEAPGADEADGAWRVHVAQDGAEGPFAKGWNLWYVAKDDAMTLSRVSMGDEKPLEAELASIVLGPQFPYEVRYAKPPKDYAVDAEKLLERSQLPPSQLPSGGTAGAAPPATAPAPAP
jgi:hypothetical protein